MRDRADHRRYHRGVDDRGETRPSETRERVSIVLATFNGAEFLDEQLESLLQQERLPDEVIVVDDASTDRTPEILRAFASRAPFPVDLELRKEHLGTWLTFEDGLVRATGDILMICDQDDVWLPAKVRVLVERMVERPEALMAFSDAELINAHGTLIGHSRWRVAGFPPRRARAVADDAFGEIFSRQAVSGCTMAIRAELLPALLPFPMDIHPGLPVMMYDRWIALTAAASAPVLAVPDRLIDYRIHPGQQIGIPALGLRRLAPRSALLASQFLHGRAEISRRMSYHVAHLEQIEKRLAATGLDDDRTHLRVQRAERHLSMRGGLARRRRDRVVPVMRELRSTDGYRRFSLGVVSAVADLAR